LKAAKLLVYGAILGGTLAACAGPLLTWLEISSAVVSDPTGAPPLALYAAAAILALGLYLRILIATLARRRVGQAQYVLAVALLGLAIGARMLSAGQGPSIRADFASFGEAPPDLQTAYMAGKLRYHVEAHALDSEGGVYPDRQEQLAPALEERGEPLVPLYRYRGERRPFNLRVLKGAPGPVLGPLEGDLAGTIYYAVAPDRKRYWISALRLDPGDRSTTIPFCTAAGRTVVLTNSPTAQQIIREKRAYEAGELVRPFLP